MRLNTIRLRKLIGYAGILLPWIVVLLIGYFPSSISATYYTNACVPFIIILGIASGFLVSYKGYELIDDVLLTCAGIAGLCICLFPCAVAGITGEVGTFMIDSKTSDIIHMISAVVFFAQLSVLVYKGFGRANREQEETKYHLQSLRHWNGGFILNSAITAFPYSDLAYGDVCTDFLRS